MLNINGKDNIVFAVYPNANGFGFVYMSSPRQLIRYGVVRIHPINNRRIIKRIRKYIDHFKPLIVVVQNPKGKFSRTGRRVKRLINRIIAYARKENLTVVQYSRDQIRDVFQQFGAITKYEISQLLVPEFKELKPKSPKKREIWTSEDHNMAIFDALSLAMTWYYLND